MKKLLFLCMLIAALCDRLLMMVDASLVPPRGGGDGGGSDENGHGAGATTKAKRRIRRQQEVSAEVSPQEHLFCRCVEENEAFYRTKDWRNRRPDREQEPWGIFDENSDYSPHAPHVEALVFNPSNGYVIVDGITVLPSEHESCAAQGRRVNIVSAIISIVEGLRSIFSGGRRRGTTRRRVLPVSAENTTSRHTGWHAEDVIYWVDAIVPRDDHTLFPCPREISRPLHNSTNGTQSTPSPATTPVFNTSSNTTFDDVVESSSPTPAVDVSLYPTLLPSQPQQSESDTLEPSIIPSIAPTTSPSIMSASPSVIPSLLPSASESSPPTSVLPNFPGIGAALPETLDESTLVPTPDLTAADSATIAPSVLPRQCPLDPIPLDTVDRGSFFISSVIVSAVDDAIQLDGTPSCRDDEEETQLLPSVGIWFTLVGNGDWLEVSSCSKSSTMVNTTERQMQLIIEDNNDCQDWVCVATGYKPSDCIRGSSIRWFSENGKQYWLLVYGEEGPLDDDYFGLSLRPMIEDSQQEFILTTTRRPSVPSQAPVPFQKETFAKPTLSPSKEEPHYSRPTLQGLLPEISPPAVNTNIFYRVEDAPANDSEFVVEDAEDPSDSVVVVEVPVVIDAEALNDSVVVQDSHVTNNPVVFGAVVVEDVANDSIVVPDVEDSVANVDATNSTHVVPLVNSKDAHQPGN